jgi:hypothetical protein
MLSAYLQFLQVQTQTGKQKLEYLRRREEREEKESTQRRELERLRLERETAEFEHNKQAANIKQRADRAIVCCPSSLVLACYLLLCFRAAGAAEQCCCGCLGQAGGG